MGHRRREAGASVLLSGSSQPLLDGVRVNAPIEAEDGEVEQFAQLEMKVVISTILARARLRAPRDRSEKARFRGVTLLPSRGGEAVVDSGVG